jgi:hypothetical protein
MVVLDMYSNVIQEAKICTTLGLTITLVFEGEFYDFVKIQCYSGLC